MLFSCLFAIFYVHMCFLHNCERFASLFAVLIRARNKLRIEENSKDVKIIKKPVLEKYFISSNNLAKMTHNKQIQS